MKIKTGLAGKRGEAAVAEFLTRQGHTVLDLNWRCGHLEVDIVTLDELGLHFVEVKTRSLSALREPQENVGYVKQRRLAAAARQYLAKKKGKIGAVEVFFDVAAVIYTDNHLEIKYFPNAFIPMETYF